MNKTVFKVIAFSAIGALLAMWAVSNIDFVRKAVAAKSTTPAA